VSDVRLLKSLEPVYSDSRKIYVEVSSPTTIFLLVAAKTKESGVEATMSR
jgi:hypothetical protein